MRRRILISVLALLGLLAGVTASQANYLGNIQISYDSPSYLPFGRHVEVTFDYNVTEAAGVRIFVLPFTDGELADNAYYSGSGVIPVGSGSDSEYFYISEGDVAVDQVRIRMVIADWSEVLLDLFLPVQYVFGEHGIYDFQYNHESPSCLALGQDVEINFNYTTTEPGGVRIFARPYTDGELTPNYGASGSPLHPVGDGSGSQSFSIDSGEAVVDQIRFWMLNADQSVLLMEFFLPAEYSYGEHAVNNVVLSPDTPRSMLHDEMVDVTFDYSTTMADGVRIWALPYTDGSMTPGYSYCGSPVYPVGSGSGTGCFRILSGEVEVDAVRILMRTADQSADLVDFYIPVCYHYAEHSITNIVVSPAAPAILSHDEYVYLDFDYYTNYPDGVRIWTLPFSNGSLPSSYAYSPSPIYPVGSGSGSGYFRIISGDIKVDQIRFHMKNPDLSELLLTYFIDAEHYYGAHGVSTAVETAPVPGLALLHQNHPNPFNPHTTIPFTLAEPQHVSLRLYDLQGRQVTTLVDEWLGQGRHDIDFRAGDLPSGVYFYKLSGDGVDQCRKMLLLK